MRRKNKFVLWQHVIIRYWLKKNDQKIHIFEVLIFFENVLLLSVSRNYLQAPSLDYILMENFIDFFIFFVKFNYFSGRPNKGKRGFEIFLIDHCAGGIRNKNISGKY